TTRDSYVTAWPSGSPKPLASSLNVAPGKTVAASAILPVGPDGAINLYTSGGSHLLVDVMGWFSDDTAVPGASGLFVPVAPVRVRDTRTGTRPAGGTAVQVPITATPSVFDATARSAVFNLTATQPAASGYLTAYPHGSSRPSSSNLNMSAPGQTIANLVVGTLGGDGATSVYTSTSSHVIVDLMGYFLP
ncbi:MAG: hypothetical protein ACJ739_02350, partial [Acidimicrobiales bacterium]